MKSFRDQPCATCGKTIKKDADMRYDGRAHHPDCEPEHLPPTPADYAKADELGFIAYTAETPVAGLIARMTPKPEGRLF